MHLLFVTLVLLLRILAISACLYMSINRYIYERKDHQRVALLPTFEGNQIIHTKVFTSFIIA